MEGLKADFKSNQTPMQGNLPGSLVIGVPGFSPSAKVEQTDYGAIITITDKDGTTSAVVKNGKDGAGSGGNVVLSDQVTGELYALYVSGGDLYMNKTEIGAGDSQIVLTDQDTGKAHRIYISNGTLTMEEV